MNIVICSSGSTSNTAEHAFPVWKHLTDSNHNIQIRTPSDVVHGTPDAIISMSISLTEQTHQFINRFPKVPLFCYNWDCYEWIWEHPRGYNWNAYGGLLSKAKEIWVPSVCTGLRTKQWWKLNNWKVVLSGCPTWNHPVINGGYALCCLRKIPDRYWGDFESACEELKIPYTLTEHRHSYVSYQKSVANCRFLVCHLHELSTGGLSLLEGYHIGKPCLVSNSHWNGARDYMGDRAVYYQHDDFEDFKSKLFHMYHNTPPVHKDHAKFVEKNFSYERMAKDMIGRINANIS